jgi:serine/threonine protein kinase
VESHGRGTRVSDLAGHRLGSYQLVELIGRGGMAVVYKAVQANLRRHVALKILPPYLLHDEAFRVRFQQEAETVARLEHPNILPIYDYGEQDDILYIVMPLVAGGTLQRWLERPVALPRAVAVLGRILDALAYAHQQNVIHRDIKPSNVLMNPGDWPLLADFGIAKLVEPTVRATRSGTIVGTPAYMAPEQCEGRRVDHRADLYAVGIILYQMLTGRLPFDAASPVALLLQQVRDPPPPLQAVRPDLAPIWDAVLGRALAKDPDERYPSAAALAEAVQAALLAQGHSGAGARGTLVSDDPQRLYASASRALAEGAYQRVISLCGRLLELDPSHPQALYLLNQAHEAQRRARTLEAGERAALLLSTAEAALQAERFAEAEETYQAALEAVPDLVAAREGLERTRVARQAAALYGDARRDLTAARWAEAARKLDTLLALAPDYKDAASLRAQLPAAPAPDRDQGAMQRTASLPATWPEAPPTAPHTPHAPPRPLPSEPTVPPRRRRAALLAAGGGVLLVGTALALLWLRPSPAEPALASATAVPPATSVLTLAATATPTAAELFPACEQAVARAAWAAAAEACETVAARDRAHPGLATALARAYTGLGREQLAQGELEAALAHFERALAARPDDPEAAQEHQLARAFQQGAEALAAGAWATAVARLEAVQAARADYLAARPDGGVAALLYQARAGWGTELLAEGTYVEAQQQCGAALALRADGPEAQRCYDQATLALRPPPTPAPTSAPAGPAPAAGTTTSPPPRGGTSAGSPPAGQRPPAGSGTGAAPPAGSGTTDKPPISVRQ